MEKLANRLKELIKENEIDEIAKYLNLQSSSIIYQWKSEIRHPRLNSLIKLANYFECSLDYLLGRTDAELKVVGYPKKSFVEQLKIIIKENGLKQATLVKDNVFSRTNIYDWSHGNNNPAVDIVLKIADYLNISVDHLVGRE